MKYRVKISDNLIIEYLTTGKEILKTKVITGLLKGCVFLSAHYYSSPLNYLEFLFDDFNIETEGQNIDQKIVIERER